MSDGTPGAKWRQEGKPDPFGDRYNRERAALLMGDMTDDELANHVYLHTDAMSLQAMKDRIRWLSRQLYVGPQLSFERFHNALRILRSIDLHELQAIGLFTEATKDGIKTNQEIAVDAWEQWEYFRDDPMRYLLACPDETARKIWTVIECRQP